MENLLKRLQEFDLEKEVLEILKGEEDFIAERNQENLMSGIDSKGNRIKPEYHSITVNYKKFKSQPSDRVTLFDEGDFYKGFFVTEKFPVDIDSKDWKTDKLADKYGENIFGLTEDKQNEVNTQILPSLIDKIRALL